jgi:hypothetical protein
MKKPPDLLYISFSAFLYASSSRNLLRASFKKLAAGNDILVGLIVEMTVLHDTPKYYLQFNPSMGWLPALPSP